MHRRVVKQTMELFNLLEKNGKIQISIIHYLLDKNLTADIPKLLIDLTITSFLFNNNVEELTFILNDLELDLSLEVDHEQNQVTLKKAIKQAWINFTIITCKNQSSIRF